MLKIIKIIKNIDIFQLEVVYYFSNLNFYSWVKWCVISCHILPIVGCYLIFLMATAIKQLMFWFENLVSKTYENILTALLILCL